MNGHVLRQVAFWLIFLIIAVSLGIVGSYAQIQFVGQSLVPQHLIVLLVVVVSLSVVIVAVALLIVILST